MGLLLYFGPLVGALLLGSALTLLYLRREEVLVRWRRRRPHPRYPLVLVHGVLGFDEVAVGGQRVVYFKEIAEALTASGIKVYRPRVPPAGSVAVRAESLKRYVESLAEPKVNIVAHSMGGLDARYAISRLGLAPRVASLVTIGTPHRGTPVADVGTNLLGDKMGLRRALEALGLRADAFYDLKTDAMIAFNKSTPDVPSVRYFSVVASASPSGQRPLHPMLLASYAILAPNHPSNDGMVPVESQRWGQTVLEIQADHMGEIGWSKTFNAAQLYKDVADRLRDAGC